jgi:7-carboxy-7-deazaguanine synthase
MNNVDYNARLDVVERFVSINGEARRAGQLAVFVRFKGCNLNCSYCDTAWANKQDVSFESMTVSEIVDYVLASKVKNVTLTGGEPLLQDNIYTLIQALCDKKLRVEIETNGAVDIAKAKAIEGVSVTMDYKAKSSGMESFMLESNYKYLTPIDTVKIVCGSIEDLDGARELILRYGLTEKCAVYISPVFGTLSLPDYVEYMIEHNLNDVNFQLQMHKFIWQPDMKGV